MSDQVVATQNAKKEAVQGHVVREYSAPEDVVYLEDLVAKGIGPEDWQLFEEAMYDWSLQNDASPIDQGQAVFAQADRLFKGKDVERKVKRRAEQYAKMVKQVKAAGFVAPTDVLLERAVYAVNQWRKWRDRSDVERKDYAPFFRQRPLCAIAAQGIDPKDYLQ